MIKVLKSFWHHPGIRRYWINTGWMFVEKFLRLLTGLFVGAYVARYLGPGQYGLLNYVISLVAIFSVIANLGLEPVIVRSLVRKPEDRDRILGTAFIMKLAGALLMFVCVILIMKLTPTDRQTVKLVYIIALGMFCEVFGVIDFFFQANVTSRYVVWSQMVAMIFVSLYRIVLIYHGADLIWFAWSSVLDLFVLMIGLIFFYRVVIGRMIRWRFDFKIFRQFFKDAWPLLFSAMAVTIYMRIDQIMVKWMVGDAANGDYGVATRLSEMWNFIPVAICSSVFPAILNSRERNVDQYQARMQLLFDLMTLISIVIALPMTFLSTPVVTILFGEAYSGAGAVLALYIWSAVFTFLGVANGKWILTEGYQVFRMVTFVSSCLLNVVLNLIWIKTFGAIGAAMATVVSYAFASYFSFAILKKTRPVFYQMSKSFNPFRLFDIKRYADLTNPVNNQGI